ncbi:MAG: GNAT family N-acetyltransferase [Pontibacter sp.]|nr:GNAT family N-acetyltransferase [Pontibacter sp.]
MIKLLKYATLQPEVRQQLDHHIAQEFGHVPFVQEREWAQPDWVLALYAEEQLATFYNVVLREVSLDGKLYRVAGINNVITPAAYRGKGYASRLLQETKALLFEQLGCSFGLLLCADALVPFYSRLGWYKLDNCALYYQQPDGEQYYDSNTMLLASTQQPQFFPQHIHLNGLPW